MVTYNSCNYFSEVDPNFDLQLLFFGSPVNVRGVFLYVNC